METVSCLMLVAMFAASLAYGRLVLARTPRSWGFSIVNTKRFTLCWKRRWGYARYNEGGLRSLQVGPFCVELVSPDRGR